MSEYSAIGLVSPVLPWPPDQGSKRFVLELAESLHEIAPLHWMTRRVGEQQSAIAEFEARGFALHLDEAYRRQDLGSKLFRRLGRELRSLGSGLPRETAFVCSPGVRREARNFFTANPESLAVAAFWSAAPCLKYAPRGRRVLVASDIESMAAHDGLKLNRNKRSTVALAKLKRAEREAFQICDLLLCLTELDMERAFQFFDEQQIAKPPIVGLLPATIPVQARPVDAAPKREGEAPVLLAYGHWHAEFNRDGIESFLETVWPRLRAHASRPRLRIVGRGAESLSGVPSDVEVVGWVEDLELELSACTAVVIPLRYAGGLRYRLLEALGYGRPVVATTVAASGAGACANEHYLEANDEDEWSAALEELLNATRAASLVSAGHDWVRGRYGQAGRRERLVTALEPLHELQQGGG